ncbi:uncharacterized protein yc1106_00563 [Curvularia clavata]|uniref:Uncharacterized protein n=1 Tax=Curvularia clavata TaxID=95742 RepID=A0A9Q8Z050_CURCL|nr:uncharacterized protein yc1106_00563 [Curvularia clavata]
MTGSDAPPISLPSSRSLSKRSRKFYDGTYKWDSDGFVDDKGVYRGFDCYDPRSRAPTPLPPLSLEVKEDAEVFTQQTTDGMLAAHESRINAKTLTFAPDPKRNKSVVTVRCNELFRGHVDRDHLIGKMEGALIASKANKVDLTLEECYRLCDIPSPDQRALQEDFVPLTGPSGEITAAHVVGENNRSPATSPKSPAQKIRSSSSSSTSLSDCPSDISNWDVGISILALASTTENKSPKSSPQEAKQPKYLTRGVKRKAKRGVKKAKA